MSTTSDVPIHGIRDDTPTQGNSGSGRGSVAAAPVPAAKNPRNKRGGKKGVNARQAAAAAASAGLDDLETSESFGLNEASVRVVMPSRDMTLTLFS